MGDPKSNRGNHRTKLQNKFELEKRDPSYADVRSEDVKNLSNMAESSSKYSHKRHFGSNMEEIVRHMSDLPSYLERGKPIQDRALSFGVMDWGKLEKWQYQHRKQGVVRSNKYSPSTSTSSLLFSTDGSSPHSTALQKSHLDTSPVVKSCSVNLDKFQDCEDPPIDHRFEKKSTHLFKTKPRGCKLNDLRPGNLPESKSSDDIGSCQTASSSSSLRGKMKIQDPHYITCDHDRFERHKTVVLVPRDAPGNNRTNDEKSDTKHQSSSENIRSDLNNDVPKSVLNEVNSERNPSSRCQSKTPEEKTSVVASKNSDSKTGSIAASKQRSISPRCRFSFSMNSKSATPPSASKRADSPPVFQDPTKDKTSVSRRAHSSPLRRLLDPIFPSKDSKVKAKVKLDLRICKEVNVDDSRTNKMDVTSSSSTKQALFQTAIKNGRPLFTFAVDDNCDILAATVRNLSGKDDTNSWIYTFFAVHEVKKKTGGWLSQGVKGEGDGFVPNVAAQMKVSNRLVSNSINREFVLFSVDPSRLDHQISDIQPKDELAAIVVQFLQKVDEEDDQDGFRATIILPGGHHSVPSKGEPSPLIERWRSGGSCDCGGWDMGCRLRTLANSPEAHMTPGRFELFFQGEVVNERPFFSLLPLKEGIFSVEYDSSLSLLQAFSICISVMECRKSSQHTRLRTYVAKQVNEDDAPITYASLPPLSPVERV